MALTPGESDRLLLFTQSQLAWQRKARGLRLNVPEATAIIANAVCEFARDGLSLLDARDGAAGLLKADDVLPEVLSVLTEVRVEARFDDGTRLVIVRNPLGCAEPAPAAHSEARAGDLITIVNEAATSIGITSHVHLAEVNPRLRLDRAAAYGNRLAIDTGSVIWLSPNERISLPMRPIGGERIMVGNTGVIDGSLADPAVRDRALSTLRDCGYLDVVAGLEVGSIERAESAVANLMGHLR